MVGSKEIVLTYYSSQQFKLKDKSYWDRGNRNGLSGHYAFLKEQDLDQEIERLCRLFHYQILREEGGFILLQKRRLYEDT